MASLIITAQNCMDLYYQQFKSDEDFFEDYHFKYLCGVAYAKILQDEYEKSYKLNLMEKGIGMASINPQWFVAEEIELKASDIGDKEIQLKACPFTFRFDMQSSGIQGLYPLNGTCGDFIRINVDDKWKLKTVPTTNIVWWYPFSDKIIFENIRCGLKKVKVLYIPSLKDVEDKCGLPDSMEADIIDWVLQRMFLARNGTVVDMTNDQNPNKALETEINTAFKNIKTNP